MCICVHIYSHTYICSKYNQRDDQFESGEHGRSLRKRNCEGLERGN